MTNNTALFENALTDLVSSSVIERWEALRKGKDGNLVELNDSSLEQQRINLKEELEGLKEFFGFGDPSITPEHLALVYAARQAIAGQNTLLNQQSGATAEAEAQALDTWLDSWSADETNSISNTETGLAKVYNIMSGILKAGGPKLSYGEDAALSDDEREAGRMLKLATMLSYLKTGVEAAKQAINSNTSEEQREIYLNIAANAFGNNAAALEEAITQLKGEGKAQLANYLEKKLDEQRQELEDTGLQEKVLNKDRFERSKVIANPEAAPA